MHLYAADFFAIAYLLQRHFHVTEGTTISLIYGIDFSDMTA